MNDEERDRALIDFARYVLAVLDSDEEWSSDTLDLISTDAIERGLARDDRGMFRAV